MASFNLGCIKGAKGEKGDSGAKGERGEPGETGACGTIPVFEIDKVETVDSASGASVEIDSSNPENPKLSFCIPKGVDGKDSSGDMISKIYDTEGKKTDIYNFATELFSKALLKTGGNVNGKISVGEASVADHCVRNISFVTSLPQAGGDGDICIVVPNDYNNTLYRHNVGSVVLLHEGETETEYVIAAKDYHMPGTVSLVRKYLLGYTEYFNYSSRVGYCFSDIDRLLECIHTRMFPELIQKKLVAISMGLDQKRHCFLPSIVEVTDMEYFKRNGKIGQTIEGVTREHYMTRDTNGGTNAYFVNSQGNIDSAPQNQKSSIRPMIVLPGDFLVENAVYNNSAVMRPIFSARAYYYSQGEWKEFMQL